MLYQLASHWLYYHSCLGQAVCELWGRDMDVQEEEEGRRGDALVLSNRLEKEINNVICRLVR